MLLELERNLVKFEEVNPAMLPLRILDAYNDNVCRGIPTNIGWHRSVGWFVLEHAGHTPCLVAAQFEHNISDSVVNQNYGQPNNQQDYAKNEVGPD